MTIRDGTNSDPYAAVRTASVWCLLQPSTCDKGWAVDPFSRAATRLPTTSVFWYAGGRQ
jgi:hypothetical protein